MLLSSCSSASSMFQELRCIDRLISQFLDINSYFLKVSKPDTEDRMDKITKVRLLTEYIRRKCMKLWVPDQHISIDERMVTNKGLYSF